MELLGWQQKEIRQIGEVITGTTPSTKKKEYYGEEYKLISPADLDNGKYVTTAHRMLSAAGLARCRMLPKDTVLVGCIGNVGKIGIVGDEKAASNQQINAVICNQEHDPYFIYYCLSHCRERLENAAVKTTVPILNKSNFEKFDILVPLLDEQQCIARVLTTAQNAIFQQERLIALTGELKRALMQKLFTEGLRGEKQKQTEIGLVPESWAVEKLKTKCDVVTSSLSYTQFGEIEENNTDDAVEVFGMKVSDMNILGNETVITSTNLVKRLDRTIASRRTVPAGTIVFPKRGAAIATNKKRLTSTWTVFDPNLIGVKPKQGMETRFLFYWFLQFDLRNITDPGLTPQLNKKDLEPLLIPVPTDNSEQVDLANIMDSVEHKIKLHSIRREKLEDFFRTLLHQLMTAQIRVNDLEL